VIVKNGIVHLSDGDYQYKLPKMPSKEEDILFYDKKKENQFWVTPEIKNVKKMRSMAEKIEYIEYWRNAWLNGLWFFNNGEPTYINGMMVDHLVFNTFANRKFGFTESQCEDFYFRELVLKNDDWEGMVWVKPRRYGATMEEITTATYILLSGFYNNISIQSDTLKKAKDLVLAPLVDSFLTRPQWMRERFYQSNGRIPQNEFKLKPNVEVKEDEDTFLGGVVRIYPTITKAVDGTENMYEFSKWPSNANPRETLDINKKTVRNVGRIGKVSCLSTTGDSDSVIESTQEWIKLVGESKLHEGQLKTKSGLVKRFVSAIHSKFLPPHFTDKYGRVNIEQAEQAVYDEINKKEPNTKEWYYEKRKLPLTEADALIAALDISYFSRVRNGARRDELMQMEHQPYEKGMFDTSFSGKVGFERDANGIWMVAVHPYVDAAKGIDTRNRFKQQNGFYYPVRNPEFFASIDPIRYLKEDTKSKHLSRFCGLIHKKFDHFGSGIQNKYAAMLLYRPDDPREGNIEMAKACKYYGSPVMYERNIPTPKDDFTSMNMLPFMLIDPKDKIHGMLMTSNKRNIQEGIDMLVSRFKTPLEGEQDQLMEVPFVDMLLDMDNFDIGNTTKFDVMMAMILLEHGEKQFTLTNTTDNSIGDMIKTLHEFLPKRR